MGEPVDVDRQFPLPILFLPINRTIGYVPYTLSSLSHSRAAASVCRPLPPYSTICTTMMHP